VTLPDKQTCWLAALACLLVIAPVSAETSWLRALTDQTLRQGADAKLPPHLSVVLGLEAKLQSTPVRQLVERVGHEVRTFNVCSSNHQKLVIMTVDEEKQAVTGYLLSPGGKLSKAVSYSPGGAPRELPLAEARSGFNRELQYWSHRARP